MWCCADVVVHDENRVITSLTQCCVDRRRTSAMAVMPDNTTAVRRQGYRLSRTVVDDDDIGFVMSQSKDALDNPIVSIARRYDDCQVHRPLYRRPVRVSLTRQSRGSTIDNGQHLDQQRLARPLLYPRNSKANSSENL